MKGKRKKINKEDRTLSGWCDVIFRKNKIKKRKSRQTRSPEMVAVLQLERDLEKARKKSKKPKHKKYSKIRI